MFHTMFWVFLFREKEVSLLPPHEKKTLLIHGSPYPSYPDTLLDLLDQQSAKPFLALPICSSLRVLVSVSCNELELLMQQANDELWFLMPSSMLPVFTGCVSSFVVHA